MPKGAVLASTAYPRPVCNQFCIAGACSGHTDAYTPCPALTAIARRESSAPLLAEEILPIAYTGEATAPVWLEQKTVDALLVATPSGNVPTTLAKQQLDHFINEIPSLEPELDRIARDRAEAQRDAHERVRQSARQRGTVEVRPVLPVDVLGAFVLLPGGNG